MKTTGIAILILFMVCFISARAQNAMELPEPEVHEFVYEKYDAGHPEILPQQYDSVEKRCNANIKLLALDKIPKNTESELFDLPLKAAAGFNDCGFYFAGAYVDQDPTTGSVKDYYCGTNTYDNHHGTDFAVWPFGFYKMENNQVEVIAAAAGNIIEKHDGEFDRNCSSNLYTANYIVILHADGSRALYWHLKSGSVTAKTLGQTVSKSEYLGVAGSSGNSSGPHLHFEVWSGSTDATIIDPFTGPCNILNSNSWWATQMNYNQPAVLKASVHTTDIVMPPCPNTETPNESNLFYIPFQGVGLAPGFAKFYIFLRDATIGSTVTLKILNPDGTVFNNNTWTHTPTIYYKASYLGYSKKLPDIPGTYTFQTTYNGVICAQLFTIINSAGIAEVNSTSKLHVFPNPSKGILNISGDQIDNGKYEFTLKNFTGQILLQESFDCDRNTIQKSFSISELANGIYFLEIESEKSVTVLRTILQK